MAYHSRKNKENLGTMKSFTNTITNTFKVKKCLFNSPNSDPDSPCIASPSNSPDGIQAEESPYALFPIRKRRTGISSTCTFKVLASNDVTPLKRAIPLETSQVKEEEDVIMASPTCSNSIKQAVQKSMADTNLAGNFSKALGLPVINGSHPDLKTITPATVAGLLELQDAQLHDFLIIDCRYPYEYKGGHIRSAINMYFKDDAEVYLFNSEMTTERKESNRMLIFYCEFSSQRAPSMLRYLRGLDRDKNKEHYPFLYYPEMYVIEGGYKAFYTHFKKLCIPPEYRTMLDKAYAEELAFYRSKCKSWNVKSKRCKRTRSLKFQSPHPSQE